MYGNDNSGTGPGAALLALTGTTLGLPLLVSALLLLLAGALLIHAAKSRT